MTEQETQIIEKFDFVNEFVSALIGYDNLRTQTGRPVSAQGLYVTFPVGTQIEMSGSITHWKFQRNGIVGNICVRTVPDVSISLRKMEI